jgi:methionine synthase II (cobalamin-independent)
MRNSRDRILTTHVGSLPRPDDLIALRVRLESHAERANRRVSSMTQAA